MTAKSYHMRRFDSIGDFVEASVKGRKDHCSSSKKGDGWSGSKTYEECVGHALHGTWDPGNIKGYSNLFENLEPNLRTYVEVGFDQGWDVGGYEVDVTRYLAGEHECMNEFLPAEHVITKRAVCLVIGHSISAWVSEEELFRKGQAVIALVRALNLLGFELEIYSEQTVRGGTERYSVLTRLCAAGDVLDESAIEYAVGNPSWLRRLIFGLEEGEPDAIRTTFGFGTGWGGYGSPDGIHHGELVGADVEIALGEAWFDRDTEEEAFDWVVRQLKAVGAIAEDAEVTYS